ncbi:sulfotransferase [Novosphingobium sp. RD2P27]|uniref:Sulfotransferase n=1 Tax=Novosphingobium kalidii TaxID=3230299 RepID=A0ABV2D2S2_9SPHN
MVDADWIIAEAERKVGVQDSDEGVRGNLERLLASLQASFPMSREGEAFVEASLLRDTVARLESLKWSRDYPEIGEEPINAPVFLMGLPRSGTTYFQYLFDRDRRFRLIRTWESIMPSPPPGFDPRSADERRAAWREMQKRRRHFEGFEALHLYDEDGSDECHAFMEQSFGAAGLNNLYRVPAFFDYLMDDLDLAETYRIHKRQLQCLQWRSERRPWALKYPNHVIGMEAILKVHPDARFVMTHRDPVQTLASISKMTFNLRNMRAANPVDMHEVGRDMLHFVSRHIDRIMEFDAGPNGSRIVHVDYYALVEDPVKEMRSIHQGLGIDTPADVEAEVAHWHATNPKNARGKNEYTLEQYGLDDAEVAERFAPYMQRFNIPREREGLERVAAAA